TNQGLDFDIFPNPVITTLNIALSQATGFEIELTTVTGERMLTLQNQNKIDVSNLAPGVYFIKVYTANAAITQKFVKQ
ncbi:MAG TPA: T9SS type A sorting domain-containing protein, partial [Chitinophagales bacterium]|nr:T9SS type A sorting domain-containing protein [Chitinophagales bacterium]